MISEVLKLTHSAYEEATKLPVETPKSVLYDTLIKITQELDEHPEDYEGPCSCGLCRSYA